MIRLFPPIAPRAPSEKPRNNARYDKPDGEYLEYEDDHDASIWSSGIPHNEAGAMAPLVSNAARITANVFGGNFFRHFHIGTADWLLRLVKALTAS